MDHITISGIEVVGHHGVLEHERALGQPFVVDVTLGLDLAPAAASDRLEDTVDYGTLTQDLAAIVAGEPAALIETVAGRLADRCLADPRVAEVEVTVHKPHAPVGTIVGDVAVRLHRQRPGRGTP